MKSTGAQIVTDVALAPQSTTAATVNGVAIDMKGFRSCVFTGISGLESGGPTAYSIVWKVQESTDGATFSDISGATATETGDISTNQEATEIDIELEQDITDYTYRYLRLVATVSFTGGVAPSILIGGTVSKGEEIKSA